MESQATILTLLASGLHWRRQWRHVSMLVSPFWKMILVFLPKSCRTRSNAAHSMLKQHVRSNIFRFLPWSKMSCRRSQLDFFMNFAWLMIDEERISQIGFAVIVFQAGVSQKHNSRRGGDAISSGANRGERWWTAWLRLGLGSGFRRSERWRWDKQCQRPSEHPVIHGSVWIIRERLTLSTRSAEMFLCVRLGG